MINHSRTLLMNVTGSAPMTNYYAEEIVDPDFRAVRLPTSLQAVRSVLFGSTPDRDMMNYRCRQLLAVAHATPLAQYLTAFDRRVTYRFDDADLVHPGPWVPTVVTRTGAAASVVGKPEAPDRSGRMHHVYTVEVTGTGTGTVQRTTDPISIVDLDFAAGDTVPLPASGCALRLTSDLAYQLHRVEIYARPEKPLADLVDAVANVGEPNLVDLFGLSRDEPWRTFRETFHRCTELPLRVGALVCAMVYRTEELR